MAGIAHAGADDKRTEGSLSEDAASDVARKRRLHGESVHFGGFDAGDGVDFFAEERRQSEQVVQVAGAEKIVLIAVEFVGAVRAETQRSAEKELGERAYVVRAKS